MRKSLWFRATSLSRERERERGGGKRREECSFTAAYPSYNPRVSAENKSTTTAIEIESNSSPRSLPSAAPVALLLGREKSAGLIRRLYYLRGGGFVAPCPLFATQSRGIHPRARTHPRARAFVIFRIRRTQWKSHACAAAGTFVRRFERC